MPIVGSASSHFYPLRNSLNMQSNMSPSGHGISLVTPFTESDQIDWSALQRIIEKGIASGADFFVVLGPGAEVRSLEAIERQRIVEFALDVLQGRRPLILGVSAGSTKSTIARLRKELPEDTPRLNPKKGLAAVLLEVPNDPGIPQSGLVSHFHAIAEMSPLPIVLHQRRGPKGSGLLAESVINLSNHPQLIAFMDGRVDLALTGEVIRNKAPGFKVLVGDDVSALPVLALGADGVVSSIGNAFPKAFSDLVGQTQFGDLTTARTTHHQLAPLLRRLEQTATATGIKAVLEHLGICRADVRLPLSRIPEMENRAVYRAIADMERNVSGQ